MSEQTQARILQVMKDMRDAATAIPTYNPAKNNIKLATINTKIADADSLNLQINRLKLH